MNIVNSRSAAPLPHGGNLGAARRLFPDAPEPFVDLSTGINPHPYPLPRLPETAFTRLPDPDALAALLAAAAAAFGAPSPAHVVAAPGTQILLPMVARLVPPGRAAILGPTYAEHARAAALGWHEVSEVSDPNLLAGADLAVLVNPNNPDGRIVPAAALASLVEARAGRGLLVVDEAFVDASEEAASAASLVAGGGLVVLRSLGKFYGLAGLRLGFAVTSEAHAERLAAELGPWAVSGPALAAGTQALSDRAWTEAMRRRLAADAARLDGLLLGAGLSIVGGTSLFRLAAHAQVDALFDRLGRSGILVRRFDGRPNMLRFGLPASADAWARLAAALRR